MDTKDGPGRDASDSTAGRSMLEKSRAEVVVHLAAKVGRLFGEDDVMETIKDNAGMTAVVAQEAGKAGVRMVYASTSEVYGDNGIALCDEINGPWSLPHNIYGLSKLWGEEVCKLYAPEGFTALRFSMPYGPGLPAGRGRAAIINMLWQAKNGMPIPVHIGAERSWCWIGDTVVGARLAIEKGEGAYNIGRDDDPTSMERVAQLACIIAGGDQGLVEMVPAPERQTVVKRLSTARIRSLGWTPRMSLYDGMEETYQTWVISLDANGAYKTPGPEVIKVSAEEIENIKVIAP
jgi:UDP-glucose 4-epimerase